MASKRHPNGILANKLLGIKQRCERNLSIIKKKYKNEHMKDDTWNDFYQGKYEGLVECYEDLLRFIDDKNGKITNPAPPATEKQRYVLKKFVDKGYSLGPFGYDTISKPDATMLISRLILEEKQGYKT